MVRRFRVGRTGIMFLSALSLLLTSCPLVVYLAVNIGNPIPVSIEGVADEVFSGTTLRAVASTDGFVDSYQWYFDGALLDCESDTLSYSLARTTGTHRIHVIVSINGSMGGDEAEFYVALPVSE